MSKTNRTNKRENLERKSVMIWKIIFKNFFINTKKKFSFLIVTKKHNRKTFSLVHTRKKQLITKKSQNLYFKRKEIVRNRWKNTILKESRKRSINVGKKCASWLKSGISSFDSFSWRWFTNHHRHQEQLAVGQTARENWMCFLNFFFLNYFKVP